MSLELNNKQARARMQRWRWQLRTSMMFAAVSHHLVEASNAAKSLNKYYCMKFSVALQFTCWTCAGPHSEPTSFKMEAWNAQGNLWDVKWCQDVPRLAHSIKLARKLIQNVFQYRLCWNLCWGRLRSPMTAASLQPTLIYNDKWHLFNDKEQVIQ